MSDNIESSSMVRLEDGEIDENNEFSMLPEPESMTGTGIVKDLRVMVKNFVKADKTQNDDLLTSAICESDKNSSEAYNSEKEIVYIDEDEMLCVRGASPVPFVVERLSYSRKSPPKDCDTIAFDVTPPKRKKTSSKRRRKRTTPRKFLESKGIKTDEHSELDNSDFKDKERSESPQENPNNLPQLCKFYLQDCCAKKSRCEYMHSQFPCKFYYMGLECPDETSENGCKLYHGGSLSVDMLTALDRHINTAPIDVLGQEFVDIRSNMEVNEISLMLQEMQEKLTSSKNVPENAASSQNDSSNFFVTLREKLYFLNEDQLNGLKQLKISKSDDLFNLTLAQLNAIGIHATQIEAIQMSFVSGQDTDMRNINPSQFDVHIKQNIPSFEVVCYNEGNTCSQNWYEKEEMPLVIDENNAQVDDENENKTLEEDNILIDVVGDSSSNSDSSIIEDEIEKVEENVALPSSSPDNTNQSHHFVIEETKEGIEVLPNSIVGMNNYFPLIKYTKTVSENSQNGEETVEKFKESEDKNVFLEITKTEQEIIPKYNELQKQIQEFDEKTNKLDKNHISEELDDKIESSEIKDQTQLDENIKKKELSQTSEKLSKEVEGPISEVQTQLNKNTTVNELSAIEDMIEKQFETKSDGEQNLLPKKEVKQSNNFQEKEKFPSEPLQNKDKNGSPHMSIKSPIEHKRECSLQTENLVAKIDLTAITPPKNKSDIVPLPIRFKVEQNRGYNNPFQRNISSAVNEVKERYSSINQQRTFYIPQSSSKSDHQMEGDNSSEDWDADERSDIQSPPKEIASPDQSDDESTPFVADGSCPELPRTKNLDNYQPALEINAHLTYPPMKYKLYEIYMPQYEVNKPTLMDKLIKSNSTDPRLKKFIEKEKNHGIFPQAEYSFFPTNISQCDPRLRPGTGTYCQDQNFNASRVLYSYLQRSQWYQELKSNLKIQINHSVSDLVRALNYFHKDPSPQKIFDLFQIQCAGVLLEVMRNVGIFIDVNGNITEEANYNQLCAPSQQQQQQHQHQQQQQTPSQQSQSPFVGVGCLGPNAKPGLLGFAPPGHPHPHHNNSSMSNENSFARQAFGHDCVCSNNNNDFQPNGPTFYVGGRYGMNRNQEPGFETPPYQKQNQKRTFKRR